MQLSGGKYFFRRFTKFWFATLAILWAAAAGAQTVTLSQAADLMSTNEVQYQILDLEAEVAAEVTRQALGQRLPRVSLSVSYIQTQQEIINQDNTAFVDGTSEYPTTNIRLSATQPLYDPVRFRALPLARAEEELVRIQAEEARTELAALMVAAYLNVARAQLQIDQARAVLRARTQFERDIGLMVSAGTADADRQLRAQGDTFAARANVSDAELDLAEALFDLQRFTGPIDGVQYRSGVGVANINQFFQTFSADRLDQLNSAIQVARAQLVVAESRLIRVRGSFQPTANLTLELENEQTDGSLFGGGSEVQSAEVGIELNWSIYEGGVRRSQVREAERRVEIANLRVQQTQEMAQRRYEALVGALRSSLSVVNANAQDRRVAVERVNVAQQNLDAGRGNVEPLLEAQLRRDTLGLQAQSVRLRAVGFQAQLYALFGALDLDTLSADFAT